MRSREAALFFGRTGFQLIERSRKRTVKWTDCRSIRFVKTFNVLSRPYRSQGIVRYLPGPLARALK